MAMEQSIFKSTKAMLDIAPGDDSFDSQVMTLINGALSDLVDFGIGPEEGFEITGDDETWDELLGNYMDLNRVRTWLFRKVQLIWDPPQTSFLVEEHKNQINELTWRLINKEDRTRHTQAEAVEEQVVLDGGTI